MAIFRNPAPHPGSPSPTPIPSTSHVHSSASPGAVAQNKAAPDLHAAASKSRLCGAQRRLLTSAVSSTSFASFSVLAAAPAFRRAFSCRFSLEDFFGSSLPMVPASRVRFRVRSRWRTPSALAAGARRKKQRAHTTTARRHFLHTGGRGSAMRVRMARGSASSFARARREFATRVAAQQAGQPPPAAAWTPRLLAASAASTCIRRDATRAHHRTPAARRMNAEPLPPYLPCKMPPTRGVNFAPFITKGAFRVPNAAKNVYIWGKTNTLVAFVNFLVAWFLVKRYWQRRHRQSGILDPAHRATFACFA